MQRLLTFLFTTALLSTGAGYAAESITDKSTGKSFPAEVTFKFDDTDYNLKATGIATRKKFFVKVYSIAHYMQDPQKGTLNEVMQEVMNDKRAKQFTAVWLRPVDEKKIHDSYMEALRKNLGDEGFEKHSEDVNQFLAFFGGGAQTNDTHIVRWIPEGVIEVEINDEVKGQIKNEEFAKAVWEIWLGPRSVVKREELVSRITD